MNGILAWGKTWFPVFAFSLLLFTIFPAQATTVTITTTGAGTWTVPANVTSVTVEVWGGGGAGGGNTTTSNGGGGGGGGGYSLGIVAVTPGAVVNVSVGTGGTGVAGGAGNGGAQTWFQTAGTVQANGGAGGRAPAGAGGVGGAGGGLGVGSTRFSGGTGGYGRTSTTGRGGPGGSSAGTAANGTNGPNPWSTLTAAAPPAGGGIGGNGGASGANGSAPASGNGGGGGGSGDSTGTNRTGGAGAGGKIIITYKTNQTITFGAQAAQTYSPGGTFAISPLATASSGLAVTYTSLTTGVCTIAVTTVTIVTAGTCTIAADQAGDANWNPAPQVTQNVTINKANQTITFGAQAAQTYSPGGTFAINPLATASSGLAITYTSTTLGVCTIVGTTVTMVTAGTCTIAADQAGNTNWNAAPQVTQNIIINAAVINTYYPGTASVLAGATSITLGAATGAATPIAIGDMLLIMQMQDASINNTNTDAYGDGTGGDLVGRGTTGAGGSGLYEYVLAASNVPLVGGPLTLSCGILNAYTNANYVAGSSGQKRFQVIRVPVYASYTINAITALAWNGSTGGVLAFDVIGALNLNTATVDVGGKGFRGGASRTLAGGAGVNTDYLTLATVANNASKGEGIAGTPQYVFTAPSTLTNTAVEGYPNGSHARGAPANGGGGGADRDPAANDENPGGGGGANGGAGGMGGIGWCGGGPPDSQTFSTTAPYYGCGYSALANATNPAGSTGGFGGAAVAGLGATRLTMGGGGGGGTTNNGTGALAGGLSSSGAAGGGIIMLRAGSMSGAATFNANGGNGDNTVVNDGSGGGGAGGVVLISAGSGMGGVTINVNGGIGGTNTPGAAVSPHGPGGGGGGGYAVTTGAPAASGVAGGASGVTYNNNVLFGTYGATAGSAGSSNSGLTAAAIPGVALGATSCIPPLDHLEIQHASGTGLTCAANTLTIKACTDAAVPCVTPYTSGVSGTLTPPTVNWNGGAGFTILAGSSTVTKDVQVATAGTVVFGITSPSPVPANATACNFGTPACTFTASLAGFIFSNTTTGNSYTIPSQVSGIATPTLYLRAVQAATTNPAVCTPAIISQPNVSVNMGYVCNNPATCQAGNLATINATPIPSGGTAVSLNFDANGSAPITARYDDVGQITLNASKTVTPFGGATPVTLTGNSNSFVVAPHHFGFSNITPGLIKAGNNFSATVTAYNGLATPTATPNFGKESVAEGVTLTSNLGAGNNPAIGNNVIPGSEFGAGGMVNDANGVATVNNLNWGEVGLITMTANLTSGSYLGSGLTASGMSGNVGRFIPDHFNTVTSGGMPCPTGLTCPTQFNGFVYSGQPFTAQVTALNLAGGTTLNYDSTLGYSRAVTLSAWDAAGGATANPGGGALTVNTIPSASFSLGAAATSTPTYTFATVPTAPTNVFVRADESAGGDGVTSLRGVSSVEGGMKIVSGRMKISNAHGSELLSLPVGVTVQYWNGTSYVTSTTDSLTTFGNANVVFSNWQKLTPASGWAAGSTSVVAPPASVAFTNGVGSFKLSKPGSGNTGSVDITTSAPVYLPSNTGRATFGVYKGSNNFIYLRENY